MQGNNVLVVGGSSGIGLAITQSLIEKGANVFVLSRTNETLEGLAVQYLQGDVLTDISHIELPDVLHGLVYCPGSINLKPFRSLKPAQFLADYEINVLGAVRILQHCLKALKKSEQPASVILFSSVAVGLGMPFHASVASAKGAVEGLTKSLAAEWAPRIRVNCIAPSLTNTPMAAKLLATPEKEEASAKRHPLQKVGQPADIAAMATLLLSDQSRWISGQIIGVDGGLSTLKV